MYEATCRWCHKKITAGYDDWHHMLGCCILAEIEALDMPEIRKDWLRDVLVYAPMSAELEKQKR